MDPVVPSPSGSSELQQLRAEVAELRKILLDVRSHQKRSMWVGVLKVLVYLMLLGGATFALKKILPAGLQGITGAYSLDASSTSGIAPPNLQDMIKNLRELQGGQ